MFLLVGLGNPGTKYQYTKHNFGFLMADRIVSDYKFSAQNSKFDCQTFSGEITGKKIILIKPQNYMNNSGSALQEVAGFYRIPLVNIIVFHDEIDLPLGKIKAKIGGGSAGHNGLKDIDEKIGKDYVRIRLGVGRPENREFEIADYVLGKFSGEELEIVDKVSKKISALLPLVLEGKLDEFMNLVVS